MSGLTDKAAYLRGMAEGMGLNKEKDEHKLMLEMLSVIDEMAQKLDALENSVSELDEYVESIDDDLSDMEEAVYGEEAMDAEAEHGCDCDCEECDECDDVLEIAFDCPHCGNPVKIKASDIDIDQSPLCPACGKPFFPDEAEEADEPQDGADD